MKTLVKILFVAFISHLPMTSFAQSTLGADTLIAERGYIHFPNQTLYGDDKSALFWLSNHDYTTQVVLKDKQNTLYGKVLGTGNGQYFGLTDGDAQWSYVTKKDDFTEFRINNNGKMRILANGNVGIGTSDPQARLDVNGNVRIGGNDLATPPGYKLYVEEGILAERVRVASKNGNEWADYVFEPDYNLNSTEEVERFIKTNKHLPNVPSAKEVGEKGVDVVEMDATLLRQIEELWLHVIELKKENETLKEKVEVLESAKR